MPRIMDLMQVPDADHDIGWLQTSLQAAVELELATIPPYLCAMWSVIDPGDPVRRMIRSIAVEEMGHLATACNLLTTIGGTPVVNTPETLPSYPGPLPGGVHPGLIVPLAGLSKDLIWNVFMEIELPQSGPVLFSGGMAFPTIGAFYDAISNAFEQLPAGAITGERQIQVGSGTGVAFTIANLADATHAIERIKEQGEGTAQSPIGDPGAPGDEYAHYYQFAEIYYGRRLQEVDGKYEFTGDPIAFPNVYPVAEVPAAGYPESANFDGTFKDILDGIQSGWETGDKNSVETAINTMFELGEKATALMKTPVPNGTGNMGPDFKLPA